jgi:hypothetical protein
MNKEPMICRLDKEGQLYALLDERSQLIGTGTKEVCEVLLYLITKPPASMSAVVPTYVRRRPNVRSAISI